MKIEKIVLNNERNVHMTAYIQEVGGEFSNLPARPAMIVLPGGGYINCSEREADPVALAYSKAGFQTFVLYYTVLEKGGWPLPLQDYDEAVAYILEHAKEWGVYEDKISCVGFSAGGHLAAMAATSAKHKPAVAVLGYPAINLMSYVPHAEDGVDRKTSPCFVFGTRTDFISPLNMLSFLAKLSEHGISFESHIYSYGPHGYSTGEHFVQPAETGITPRAAHWVEDSIGFIKEIIGDFGESGMTAPAIGRRVNGDDEPMLSVFCTTDHLLSCPAAEGIMSPVIQAVRTYIPGAMHFGMGDEEEKTELFSCVARALTLRDLLTTLRFAKEKIAAIDAQLNTIENK